MLVDSRPSLQAVVVFGKIVGAYGVKGWVHIHPFADDPLSWRNVAGWQIKAEGQSSAEWMPVRLRQFRFHGDSLIASFDEVNDRSAAEALVGNLIGASREALPATAEDEFYWGDLVGLEVRNLLGESFGVVRELMETGANTVLVVVDAQGAERLLPFVSHVVGKIDLDRREVQVDWGLDW